MRKQLLGGASTRPHTIQWPLPLSWHKRPTSCTCYNVYVNTTHRQQKRTNFKQWIVNLNGGHVKHKVCLMIEPAAWPSRLPSWEGSSSTSAFKTRISIIVWRTKVATKHASAEPKQNTQNSLLGWGWSRSMWDLSLCLSVAEFRPVKTPKRLTSSNVSCFELWLFV